MAARWRRILLCLALGALTTLLVAWILAVKVVVNLAPAMSSAGGVLWHSGPEGRDWHCLVMERRGLTVIRWTPVPPNWLVVVSGPARPASGPVFGTKQSLPRWARPPEDLLRPDAIPGATGATSARGWPVRALCYEATFNNPAARVNHGGIPVPELLRRLGPGPVLPCRVLAAGFALDTAFWAASWWGLLAIAALVRSALRASIRRREGHCSSCGYDLRGAPHDRCPECGEMGTFLISRPEMGTLLISPDPARDTGNPPSEMRNVPISGDT